MADGFQNPTSDPFQSMPQPAFGPPPRIDVQPESRSGGFRLGWALWLLAILILVLFVPSLVEQIQYASARGRQRAEAEIAREQLERGHNVTIGDYRYVVKAIQPSVVGVKAARIVGGEENDELSSFLFGPNNNGPRMREQDQGSGVIVDAAGYIITNYHVVDRATDVNIEMSDGSHHKAQIVGIDPATDLAVLKISASGLIAAPWGDSSDLEAGDPVLAIGNPFGLARTVTAGIVSAKGRHAVVEHVNYQDFLQTDAAVNPGNSGGPLVNMKAQVVGINTAIVGPTYQGISFAIPSKLVHEVYDQLIATGKVARGWLGVSMRELSPEQSEKLGVQGALVADVVADSPAAEAGLRRGDIIAKWKGKSVSGPTELGLAVAWSKIGEKAAVVVRRGKEDVELIVSVGQRAERVK